MKKITAIMAFAAAAFCFLTMLTANKPTFFNGYADSYEVYFDNGSFGDIKTQVDKAELYFLSGVKGLAFTAKDNFNEREFISELCAERVFEEVCFGQSVYYYSKKIPFYETINGQRVNIQIHTRETSVKVGAPVIYGSF